MLRVARCLAALVALVAPAALIACTKAEPAATRPPPGAGGDAAVATDGAAVADARAATVARDAAIDGAAPGDAAIDAAITVRDAGTVSHHAPACDPAATGPDIALDVQTPVANRRVYLIAGTTVSLCVVRTAYGYSSGKGHRLWAMVDLFTGKDAATYDLSTNSFAKFHGVRISVGIARKEYVGEPGVWIRAQLAP